MVRRRWLGPTLAVSAVATMSIAFQNCGEFKISVSDVGLANQSIADVPADLFGAQPQSGVVERASSKLLTAHFLRDGASVQWYFRRLGTQGFVALSEAAKQDYFIQTFDATKQGDYKMVATLDGVSYESQVASLSVRGLNNTCLLTDISKLPLPLAGQDGGQWTVNGYVDLDPAVDSSSDYKGNSGNASRAADGRRGVDFALPHFKAMDAGVEVRAVADGFVESMDFTRNDRNLDYSHPEQNYVRVRLANGFSMTYGLLKKESTQLAPGLSISKGDLIGHVGASGATNIPALRFEVANCLGETVDPMLAGGSSLFLTPPLYDAPAAQMDLFFRSTAFTSMNDVKLISGASLSTSALNTPIYFAGYFAHIHGGDVIRLEFTNPSGVVVQNNQFLVPGTAYYGLYDAFDTVTFGEAGTWKITAKINGAQVSQIDWVVTP